MRYATRFTAGLSLLLLAAACGGGPTGPNDRSALRAAPSVSLEQGASQSVPPRTWAADSTVVRVTASSGAPVEGELVSFEIRSEGGGMWASSSLLTNGQGRVHNLWRSGDVAWTRLWLRSGDTAHSVEVVVSREGQPDVVRSIEAVVQPGPLSSSGFEGLGFHGSDSSMTVPLAPSAEQRGYAADEQGNPIPFDLSVPSFASAEEPRAGTGRRLVRVSSAGCGPAEILVRGTAVAWGVLMANKAGQLELQLSYGSQDREEDLTRLCG